MSSSVRNAPTGARASATTSSISLGAAGETPLVTLVNAQGMTVRFMGRGGIILSMLVPDRDGIFADVVLGFREPAQHVGDRFYIGALVGRNANRIAGGTFELDGVQYVLTRNDGRNHLHGGALGFNAHDWSIHTFERDDEVGAELSLESPAGDQGYPGTVRAKVTYTLTNANEFIVEYRATVDAPTPINLAQHTYFNLKGCSGCDILDHELQVFSSNILPVDANLIPTGVLQPVEGTPFDFREPCRVGARIRDNDKQLRFGAGYDHNFVLDQVVPSGDPTRFLAARLSDPASGRMLDVLTTKPGIQVYTGNELDQVTNGKGGAYVRHAGIALETQHFPDTPNQPTFPTTVVRPGEEYFSETTYRFFVDANHQLGR